MFQSSQSLFQPPAPFTLPRVLRPREGSYEVIRQIGKGGMGEVYLARRQNVAGFVRLVALKRFPPPQAGDERAREMFLDEARLAARLRHRNIAQVYDLEVQGDELFIVMEYVDGASIENLIESAYGRRRVLSESFACYVAAGLAAALHYLHSLKDERGRPLGILHRDVSPQNVMLDLDGVVKLLDFGVTHARIPGRTDTGSLFKSKSSYVSPEQLTGESLDCRSDLFALGLVLAELLTARRLFEGTTLLGTFQSILAADPREILEATRGVSPELQQILLKALARDREQRYQSADEFRLALEAFVERSGQRYGEAEAAKEVADVLGHPDSTRTTLRELPPEDGKLPVRRRIDPRRLWRWLGLAVLLLAALVGAALIGAWFVGGSGGGAEDPEVDGR